MGHPHHEEGSVCRESDIQCGASFWQAFRRQGEGLLLRVSLQVGSGGLVSQFLVKEVRQTPAPIDRTS